MRRACAPHLWPSLFIIPDRSGPWPDLLNRFVSISNLKSQISNLKSQMVSPSRWTVICICTLEFYCCADMLLLEGSVSSGIRFESCSAPTGGRVMCHSGSLVCVCAWCKRVRNDNGLWVELGVPAAGVRVTHGICPDCHRGFRLEIRRYRK
jgi:hypothetical protein